MAGIDPRQKSLWLYELNLNGFIILRNFLPLDLIEAMHAQFLPLLQGEIAKLTSGDERMLRGSHRLSFDLRDYISYLRGPLDDDRFRRNPVIEELVTAVLDSWRYGVTKAECPLKNAATMAWHPDVPNDETRDPSKPPRPVRLTFNVPLVDVNDSNGAMEIIPGSHRMHHHDCAAHILEVPHIYPTRILLRRGDAMLRDGNALHRGTTNMTDEPRVLLDQTYRALEG
ncbi:MAG TPA: phytanoyl-CoA dioxygenase family protein [Patescibacteria group bacterium]|nr:phytanoyl-CoA dioxygenase family protein [Patescibacteria group bacterium]